MKKLFCTLPLLVLVSCTNSPIGFRSNIYINQQEASTDGKIDMYPNVGPSSIEADKTTTDSYKASANKATDFNTQANIATKADTMNTSQASSNAQTSNSEKQASTDILKTATEAVKANQ